MRRYKQSTMPCALLRAMTSSHYQRISILQLKRGDSSP
jgi:hypothetical protein